MMCSRSYTHGPLKMFSSLSICSSMQPRAGFSAVCRNGAFWVGENGLAIKGADYFAACISLMSV